MKPIVLSALAALVLSCSEPLHTAGGTSDSGNPRVIATAIYKNGMPAAHAVVKVRRSDYTSALPGLAKGAVYAAEARTDSMGRCDIATLDTGTYCVEITDSASNSALSTFSVSEGAGTIVLSRDTLLASGSIRGAIVEKLAVSAPLYVQMFGLERLSRVDAATGKYLVPAVPRGAYKMRILSSSADIAAAQVPNVAVTPAETSTVATTSINTLGQWRFSQKLVLNTTASGAQVFSDIVNFPVLVRLGAAHFDFGDAAANGNDVRFAKSDGTALPFEIEKWDSAGGEALVWVRVDTVYAGDSTHYFTMYWGASTGSATGSVSNGPAVFDTGSGFQGVWHMNQAAGTQAKDATLNNYDGAPLNSGSITPEEGAIGTAQAFDGQAGYYDMTGTANGKVNFPKNGTYSISAWAYVDTLDNHYHTIAAKGDFQYNLETVVGNKWQFAEFNQGIGWDMTTQPASARVWAYLTGVRQGPNEFLYVNGDLASSTIEELPDSTSLRNAGFDFMIGRIMKSNADTTAYFFKGMIDEVRVCSVAPSGDWIKLCYMNQKIPDKLVMFGQ